MKTMEPLGNLKVNSSALVKFNKSKAKSYTAFKWNDDAISRFMQKHQ